MKSDGIVEKLAFEKNEFFIEISEFSGDNIYQFFFIIKKQKPYSFQYSLRLYSCGVPFIKVKFNS